MPFSSSIFGRPPGARSGGTQRGREAERAVRNSSRARAIPRQEEEVVATSDRARARDKDERTVAKKFFRIFEFFVSRCWKLNKIPEFPFQF